MRRFSTVMSAALLLGCGSASNEEDPGTTQQMLSRSWVLYQNVSPNPAAGVTGFVQSNTTEGGKTHVTLHVTGLPPNRAFGSHVHVLPCEDPAQAGGHYRNEPAGPATPENEIWLDFTTNAAGVGHAQAIVDFLIRHDGAHSVVNHALATDPATGAAGPKLACQNHDFG